MINKLKTMYGHSAQIPKAFYQERIAEKTKII